MRERVIFCSIVPSTPLLRNSAPIENDNDRNLDHRRSFFSGLCVKTRASQLGRKSGCRRNIGTVVRALDVSVVFSAVFSPILAASYPSISMGLSILSGRAEGGPSGA